MASEQQKPPLLTEKLQRMGEPKPATAELHSSVFELLRQGLLANTAQKAALVAESTMPYLEPGKVWVKTGPGGRAELKAGILYENTVVAVLNFDIVSGELMPLGLPPKPGPAGQSPEQILARVEQKLPAIVSKLAAAGGAEYREPEHVWVVPLLFEGMLVGHLRVSEDGTYIVPDYPADEEMKAYAR